MSLFMHIGQLIDGTSSQPLRNVEVAVENGSIISIREQTRFAKTRSPDLDFSRATALPGFIDLHSHFCYLEDAEFQKSTIQPNRVAMLENGFRNAREWLYQGVTTARIVGTPFDLDISLKKVIQEEPRLGPRLVTAGRMMTMVGGKRTPWDYMKEEINGAEEARSFTRKHLQRGADVIKLYSTTLLEENVDEYLRRVLSLPEGSPDPGRWGSLTIEEIQAVSNEAHKVGKTVAAHVAPAFGIKIALKGGVDTIEHGSEMDDECIDLFLQTGATLVPTLSVTYHQIVHGDELGIPHVYTDFALKRWDHNREMVLKAYQAGVKIGTGTDAVMSGMMYFPEIEQLAEIGLAPKEAIRCGTQRAAQCLGRAGKAIGTLEPGKLADMVILDADPLADIHNIRSILAVLKAGEIVAEPKRASSPGKVGHHG
jgi:imidazolonepropionase-like amidohydrolase